MWALLSDQGTAASETGLCDWHVRNAMARQLAYSRAGDDVPWRGTGPDGSAASFVDVTGNDEVRCLVCGQRAPKES